MNPQSMSTVVPSGFQERYERLQSDLHELQQNLENLTETASSDDNHVTVSVGARGDLRELTLDPRIYRNTDADALAEKIKETIWAANDAVMAKVMEMAAPLMPTGQSPEELSAAFGRTPSRAGGS